ncbi:GNAT family N-acetyltransferase [Streptomyces sp. ISL-10]|uniref:GNAT family N-acetyltransferase n=1 Tax=Streptomyces sp. ISL-10 TaxID=2819172 RepID=UPI001BEA4651|nr:GNAT family N-acetyltransferase [Streptomyces sp. ISL-10]MBT2365578.1 GNAT family N-acetyltransferase [Streptomyces sp. ISL-10]
MSNSPTGLRIETVHTLEKVDPAAWDTLAEPEGFYMSHGWLSSVEYESGVTLCYLLAYRGDRLVGGLPVYDVERENQVHYSRGPRLEQLGADPAGTWTIAGSHRGYSSGILRAADCEEEVLDALLAAERELGRPTPRTGSLYLFATSRTAAALHRRGAAVDFECGDATIHTGGRDVTAYCGSLRSRNRVELKREYARFRDAGYRLGRQRLSECLDEAAPLLANLQTKYGHSVTAEQSRTAFAWQAASLDDCSVVFTARDGGKLVALSVMYAWRGTLYARAVGFDYEALRDAFEYYGVCYYLPIDYMSSHGLNALHLGIGSYGAKTNRGARVAPLWTVALADDPADTPRPAPADVSRWRAEYGERATPRELWDVPWARGC